MLRDTQFKKKSRASKRKLYQEPWNYPLITFQLAATVLQGQVRGALVRRKPNKRILRCKKSWDDDCEINSFIQHVAAIEIQTQWKLWAIEMRLKLEQLASTAIQGAWRRRSFRKIYLFYKKLIQQTEVANPKQVLRAIIPNEVRLFDSSAKIHVRFRLGGSSFPPMLLYKIYTSRAVCDIGAFAPRAYMNEQILNPNTKDQAQYSALIRVGKKYFRGNMRTELPAGKMTDGWYCREENNQYRPVAAKAKNDICRCFYGNSCKEILFLCANEPWTLSHDRPTQRRQNKVKKKARMQHKRFKWTDHHACPPTTAQSKAQDSLVNIVNEQDSLDDMLRWSCELDFDDYLSNWSAIGTSAAS